ncbi:MAG: hypothetical protein RIS35_3343 [Pseudomonadota bacterium]|jgi:cytoskeletal protein RodZ
MESEELIARRLLLSVSQVKGIERGTHDSFYSQRHYVDAARRYARSMGIDFDTFQPTPVPEGEVQEPISSRGKGVGLKIGLSVAGVAGIAGVLALASLVSGGDGAGSSASGTVTTSVPFETSPSAQTASGAAPTPVPVQTSPAAVAPNSAGLASPPPSTMSSPSDKITAARAASDPGPAAKVNGDKAGSAKVGSDSLPDKPLLRTSTLRLDFSGTTWVQVVWRDGRRQTRTFHHGETLTLNGSSLQAIVVGNPSYASMTAGSKQIDLASYRQPGHRQAKIVGNRLRTLGS